MSNWRYTYNKEDIILSDEEHQQVVEGIRQKATLIVLRKGNLGLNPAFIRKFQTTEQLTDEQVENRTKNLALEGENYKRPTPEEREENRKKHDAFMEKFSGKKIDWRMNQE